ncbi:hypothetical protein [Caenimonas koreensis]|uniref:hypothetical protein n=1 Tax=Caenimonas koreensis TaxID=367474 RepID=UPI003783D997
MDVKRTSVSGPASGGEPAADNGRRVSQPQPLEPRAGGATIAAQQAASTSAAGAGGLPAMRVQPPLARRCGPGLEDRSTSYLPKAGMTMLQTSLLVGTAQYLDSKEMLALQVATNDLQSLVEPSQINPVVRAVFAAKNELAAAGDTERAAAQKKLRKTQKALERRREEHGIFMRPYGARASAVAQAFRLNGHACGPLSAETEATVRLNVEQIVESLVAIGRFDEAIAWSELAMSHLNAIPQAAQYLRNAEYLLAANKPQQALELVKIVSAEQLARGVDIAPDAAALVAKAHFMLGNEEEALRAAESAPASARHQIRAMVDSRRSDEAARDGEFLLMKGGDSDALWAVRKAEALFAAGDAEGGINCVQDCLAANPTPQEVQQCLRLVQQPGIRHSPNRANILSDSCWGEVAAIQRGVVNPATIMDDLDAIEVHLTPPVLAHEPQREIVSVALLHAPAPDQSD